MALRLALFPFESEDSTIYLLPWMEEFRNNGAAALGGEFSNYNFPYLLLMYVSSLLPIEPLFAIKLVSLLGDCLLAISTGLIFQRFRSSRLHSLTAALLVLFLPTVLINASMWGQCDAFYTAFLLLSLQSLLHNDGRGAWLWWATAIAFKLQAVFFLPALIAISLRNRLGVRCPAMAAGLWLLLSIPPVLFGRSWLSTLSVYINQTQEYRLVAGAANIYTWFPTATAQQGRIPAIVICGVGLMVAAVGYWRGPDSEDRRVLLAITVVALCPLLLPQMHDRYFFAAEVMSLLVLGHGKLHLTPWLFASTGAFVYVLYFLSNQYAWPLILASLVQCFVVAKLLRTLWRSTSSPADLAALNQ